MISDFRRKVLQAYVWHLPKLPVPDLERTMGRYLDNLRPLLEEERFERTRKLVEEFADPDGPGPKLQRELLARREAIDNWAYDWWLQDMYLGVPLPLPINSNPGMVFPPKQFKGFSDIASYAARIAMGLSNYKDKLDKREIPIEKATSREKGQPLCMSQNYRLMTSYRVPGVGSDSLMNTEPDLPRSDQHFIVACRNKFYCVELRKDENRLSEEETAGHILAILERATDTTAPALGLLTSARRPVWAELREELLKHEENRESLRLIESSLFLICLDQEPLGEKFNRRSQRGAQGMTVGGRDETNMAHQMLHGGGSRLNTPNRWFDKTIQIVISRDGACGLCYEHSPSEAVALIGMVEELLASCEDTGGTEVTPASSALKELVWVDPRPRGGLLTKAINEAARSIDNLIDDLDFYVYRFDGYGKNFIKSCKVSPDAYIQMALQLAYYKLYGRLTATYESASTRRFRLGRVDCIRSASWEALQWVSAMCQLDESAHPLSPSKKVTFSLATNEEKLTLFDKAMAKQTETMVENILGEGMDIHLLGLREQAKEERLPLELFSDDSYRILNHFALSTSQVATKVGFMGYGPVVADGYGASYNIHGDTVIFCLSAFYSSELTSTQRFAQSLEESLTAMRALLSLRLTTS